MDESWRMRMGKPTSAAACFKTKHPISAYHHRFTTTTDDIPHRKSSDNPFLEADDFNDVFGGPPRTVISRQFSGNNNENCVFPSAAGGGSSSSSNSSCFYEDVFQPKEKLGNSPMLTSPGRGRKSLPEFLGPAEKCGWRSDQFEGFYGDIFGWKEEETRRLKSRSRSKPKMAGSTWILSSEDMSPLTPVVGAGVFGDDDIALLASKLRSINVSRRWDSNEPTEEDIHNEYQGISSNYPSSRFEYDSIDNIIKCSNVGFRRKNTSPDDSYPPSSVPSSLSKDDEVPVCGVNQESGTMQGDNEAMRSYVIEINGSQGREERDDAIGVEDAIAWAKEKFQTYCSSLEERHTNKLSRNPDNYNETAFATENGESDDWSSAEDKEQIDNTNMEMDMLNEKIRLWSSGKEADIRLLLSTLHHVLWEDNQWVAVSLTNVIESRDVKKVYQRARLLLHPDKLQQKGATFLQKYIAEKAFPILQDAWAAFVSEDA